MNLKHQIWIRNKIKLINQPRKLWPKFEQLDFKIPVAEIDFEIIRLEIFEVYQGINKRMIMRIE